MDWLESKGEKQIRPENHMYGSRRCRFESRGPLARFGYWMLLLLLLVASPAARADRNSGADGEFSERKSSHFTLLQDVAIDRYSGAAGSRRFERDVLAVLEKAHHRVGDLLGMRPRARVTVVLYDPAEFDRRFQDLFGFRTAGFFDGTIHVRAGENVDTRLVRTLYHEYMHAAIQHAVGPGLFPAWLNEGLAEYLESLAAGTKLLTRGQRRALAELARSGQWIPLAELGTASFSHLHAESAPRAYLESLAIVEHMMRRHGEKKMKRFCDELARTRNLARSLQRTYRSELAEIESDLLAELR